MVEKRVVEFIVVPPEFAMLFLIPIVGAFLIFDRFCSLFWAAAFYFTSQIGLALLARHIYG
tara:strand:+ start:500 stop:682 length:183 start_codon:yes stop_codon:yes gene_type:complete